MTPELPTIYYDDLGTIVPIYKLPPSRAPDQPSVLLFSMPKAGSVLLHNIMKDVCQLTGHAYVALMTEFFQLGLTDDKVPASASAVFLEKGYCFGGFRNIPASLEIPLVGKVKSILLVRDPRDMLVSHYFSSAFSHPERGTKLASSKPQLEARAAATGMTIDAYVLLIASTYKIMFARYFEFMAQDPDMAIYRYEDFIYRKLDWLADVLDHLGWKVRPADQKAIVDRYDQIPKSEQADQHVRQVHPGNYKTKLIPETIAKLDVIFAQELSIFGYEPSRSGDGLRWRA